MQDIFEALGLSSLNPVLENRFILSAFSGMIFFILIYFWWISKEKIKSSNKNGTGLIYLAMVFLLVFLLGMVSIFRAEDKLTLLILSGLISFSYLSSLSFFSLSLNKLDALVGKRIWVDGIKYLGFTWVIAAAMGFEKAWVLQLDMVFSLIAIGLAGYFIVRYFWHRRLLLIAVVSAVYFLIYLLLQIDQPGSLSGGKFAHLSTVVIGPALLMAVIALAYTFNWINELNFHQLSKIWIDPDSTSEGSTEKLAQLEEIADLDEWKKKIAKDDLESVIERMIIYKQHRNESLEILLNIASRNTRNNNNQLKQIIDYKDYQLNRNRVADGLLTLIKQQ